MIILHVSDISKQEKQKKKLKFSNAGKFKKFGIVSKTVVNLKLSWQY